MIFFRHLDTITGYEMKSSVDYERKRQKVNQDKGSLNSFSDKSRQLSTKILFKIFCDNWNFLWINICLPILNVTFRFVFPFETNIIKLYNGPIYTFSKKQINNKNGTSKSIYDVKN